MMAHHDDPRILGELARAGGNIAERNMPRTLNRCGPNFVVLTHVEQHKIPAVVAPARQFFNVNFAHYAGPFDEPMRSRMGLEAFAYKRFSMRPARNA